MVYFQHHFVSEQQMHLSMLSKPMAAFLPFSKQSNPVAEGFENIVGKTENTGNQHFVLFPQYFLPYKNFI